jgi:hypothetical protein
VAALRRLRAFMDLSCQKPKEAPLKPVLAEMAAATEKKAAGKRAAGSELTPANVKRAKGEQEKV